MSEMLGNQYFLSRNFLKAKEAYETVLLRDPQNDFVKKRLIICYTQSGEIDKAFDLFYEIVKKDIDILITTDIIRDDCPCPELLSKYGNVKPDEESSRDTKLMLGMLWLYCDAEMSLEFFDSLAKEDTTNFKFVEVMNKIKSKINKSQGYNSFNN